MQIIRYLASASAQAFGTYLVLSGGSFLLIYVLTWKWSKRARLQSSPHQSRAIAREILFSAFHALISTSVVTLPILIFPSSFALYSDLPGHGYAWLIFSVFLLFAIHETYFFWAHYLLHRGKLFCWFHSIHHQSTNPSPFAAYCLHPVESVIQVAWIIPVAMFIPIHRGVFILFFEIAALVAVVGHLGVELYPQWLLQSRIGRYFGSATTHNLHHVDGRVNLSLYFRFWDMLMGTNQ